MELRVESVPGVNLPAGCYVGVRVGEVLKQGRYEPNRCYHFPQIDRRRSAKVDLYQHVGSCIVPVDPEMKSTHELAVSCSEPALRGLRLKVSVESKSKDTGKEHREARAQALKTQAKDYLSKHCIEDRLSDAVKALLREQPEDPTEFLCRHLRSSGEEAGAGAAASGAPRQGPGSPPQPQAHAKVESAPGTKPAAGIEKKDFAGLRLQVCDKLAKAAGDGTLAALLSEAKDIAALRLHACDVLLKASGDGRLATVLSEEKSLSTVQAGSWPAAATSTGKAAVPPSLGFEESPHAMVVSTVSLLGGSALTMGMMPSLLFI